MSRTSDLIMRIVAKDDATGVLNKVAGSTARVDKAQRGMTKSSARSAGALKTLRRAVVGLGASYAAIKIARFAKTTVDASSSLQEALNANNVMFNKQSDLMRQWASTASETFGQSERQALTAAKQFAVFGETAGLQGKKLSGFSQNLAELASDLASFHDSSVDEAIAALSSGLGGEMEAMRRRYGVLLDVATLKERALKMGLIETGEALDQQSKILAARAEIFAQTKQEQGDFARTQDDWAQQVKTGTANWEEFKAAIGAPLMAGGTPFLQLINKQLPAFTKGVEAATPAISAMMTQWAQTMATNAPAMFDRLQQEWPQIRDALLRIGEAAVLLGRVAKTAFDIFNLIPDAFQSIIVKGAALALVFGKLRSVVAGLQLAGLTKGFTGLAGALTVGGTAGHGAAAGLAAVGGSSTKAAKPVGRLGSAMGAIGPAAIAASAGLLSLQAANEHTTSAARQSAATQEDLYQQIKDGGDILERSGEHAAGFWTKLVGGKNSSFDNLKDELGILDDFKLWGNQDHQNLVHEEVDKTVEALNKLAQADPQRAANDLQRLVDAMKSQGLSDGFIEDNFGDLAGSIRNWRAEMGKSHETALNSITANSAFTQSLKSIRAQLKSGTSDWSAVEGSIASVTATQLAQRDAALRAANGNETAVNRAKAAYETQAVAIAALIPAGQRSSAVFAELASSIGVPIEELARLADSYASLPKKVQTDVLANTDSAWGRLAAYKSLLNAVPRVVTTTVQTLVTGKKPPGSATGGKITGPGTGTSDSILHRLSDGEWVIRERASRKYGDGFMAALNEGRIDPDDLPAFAKGGKAGKKRRKRFSRAEKLFRQDNPFPKMHPDILGLRVPKRLRGKGKDKQRQRWENKQRLKQARRDWREQARESQDSKVQSMRETALSGMGRAQTFASVSGFDLNAAASAQESLRLAQTAAGSANSPNARKLALKQAHEASLEASRTAATPGNVKAWMAGKLAKLTEFNTIMSKLKSKGLHPVTLAEVGGLAPDEGVQLGKALLGADLSGINNLQNKINTASGIYGVGQQQAGARADNVNNQVIDKRIRSQARNNNRLIVENRVYLDGKEIRSSLNRLDKRRGR